jgi:hypothetical protein
VKRKMIQKEYTILDYIVISLVSVGILIAGMALKILIWITYFEEKYEKRQKANKSKTLD